MLDKRETENKIAEAFILDKAGEKVKRFEEELKKEAPGKPLREMAPFQDKFYEDIAPIIRGAVWIKTVEECGVDPNSLTIEEDMRKAGKEGLLALYNPNKNSGEAEEDFRKRKKKLYQKTEEQIK